MTPVIWYESDGYRMDRPKLMGRQSAGAGFLNAFARYGTSDRFVAVVRTTPERDEFIETMQALRPGVPVTTIPVERIDEVAQYGLLSFPGPITPNFAFLRDSRGPRAWSLSGVTHTIASARIMDTVTGWLTAPVQPWDAVVCTSRAVVQAIQHMLESQAAMLRERLGAQRFIVPKLPLIPLGVDSDARVIAPADRGAARSALEIAPDDVVVLFVGRLSYHAKAHPAAMYLALERAAAGRRIVLIECGWTVNEGIAKAFDDGRAELCPSVRSIVLDGRNPVEVRRAWCAADIFCSLSDNIQETFGLTPIEAMASGLPSVVTDWDGYRDTVRDGVDGFTVPTLMAARGIGGDLAVKHALGWENYDTYLARASLATVVDIAAAAAALVRLAEAPDLRRRMGEAAARRAREVFDWSVVIRAYEELWTELDAERTAVASTGQGLKASWPARPDPFELFAGYPTRGLTKSQTLRLHPAADTPAFERRLNLRLAQLSSVDRLTVEKLAAMRQFLRRPMTVEKFLAEFRPANQAKAARAILLLAKFGFVEIVDPPADTASAPGAAGKSATEGVSADAAGATLAKSE